MKIYRKPGVLQVVLIATLLGACSGEDEDIAPGTGTIYIAVRAINDNEESSGFSNEVSTSVEISSELTLSFNEPSQQMDGDCLSNGINRYIVHYGKETGYYSDEISIARNSTQLTCTAVGSDPTCGDITNCSVSVSIVYPN